MPFLQLRNRADTISFRLSSDMIEQLNEVARLSRAIAKACRSLREVQTPEGLLESGSDTPTPVPA